MCMGNPKNKPTWLFLSHASAQYYLRDFSFFHFLPHPISFFLCLLWLWWHHLYFSMSQGFQTTVLESEYSIFTWFLHIDSLSLVLVFCSISQPLEPSDPPANWTNTNITALTLLHPWTQEIFHVSNNPQSLTVNANYLQESPYSPTWSLLRVVASWYPGSSQSPCQPQNLKETHSHQYQIVTSICGTPRSAGTMPSNLGKKHTHCYQRLKEKTAIQHRWRRKGNSKDACHCQVPDRYVRSQPDLQNTGPHLANSSNPLWDHWVASALVVKASRKDQRKAPRIVRAWALHQCVWA
jgi:hypothetical protein